MAKQKKGSVVHYNNKSPKTLMSNNRSSFKDDLNPTKKKNNSMLV